MYGSGALYHSGGAAIMGRASHCTMCATALNVCHIF